MRSSWSVVLLALSKAPLGCADSIGNYQILQGPLHALPEKPYSVDLVNTKTNTRHHLTVDWGVWNDKDAPDYDNAYWFKDMWRTRDVDVSALPQSRWEAGYLSRGPRFAMATYEGTYGIRRPYVWSRDIYDVDKMKSKRNIKRGIDIVEAEAGGRKRLLVMKTLVGTDPGQQARLENEVSAYKYIRDRDIGPRFRGFVRDTRGRFVGFLVDYLRGAQPVSKSDGDQVELCRKLLKKLHAKNIMHGDAYARNCLIADDRAYLIDFEASKIKPPSAVIDIDRELATISQ